MSDESAAQRMQVRRDWRALREEDRVCEHCGFHSPMAMICGECESFSKGVDAGIASAESSLATSTALAAEQALEIERLKGERDEARRDTQAAVDRHKRDSVILERAIGAANRQVSILAHDLQNRDGGALLAELGAVTKERNDLRQNIVDICNAPEALLQIAALTAERDGLRMRIADLESDATIAGAREDELTVEHDSRGHQIAALEGQLSTAIRQRDAALQLALERHQECEELHAAMGEASQRVTTPIAALRAELAEAIRQRDEAVREVPLWLQHAITKMHGLVDQTDPNDPVGIALTVAGLERNPEAYDDPTDRAAAAERERCLSVIAARIIPTADGDMANQSDRDVNDALTDLAAAIRANAHKEG